MKLLNQKYYHNVSFQKSLAAKAKILSKDGTPQEVNIHHLDDVKDEEYLQKAICNKNWKDNFYLEAAAICFADDYKDINYYTMEDKNHNLLCYCVVDENNEKQNKLTCIETMPKQSSYADKKRDFKYIGETMLAFLAKKTGRQGKELYISSIAQRPKTKQFYFDHCKCVPCGERNAIIKSPEINKLVEFNEGHVNSKIQLIA